VDGLDLPHIFQRTLTATHQIALAWLGTVQRQQLGQVIFKHQAEFLFFGGIGPLSG
jgi:hypothetical protein